jgi:uncharacterized membrane protein
MEVVRFFIAYATVLVTFAGIDYLWLGILMKHVYRAGLGHLMAPTIQLWAAVLFYAVYTLGLFFFAISPGLLKGSPLTALILGGLVGLLAYATYDLSNLATLRNWPVALTFIDIAWGTLLSSFAAVVGVWIMELL